MCFGEGAKSSAQPNSTRMVAPSVKVIQDEHGDVFSQLTDVLVGITFCVPQVSPTFRLGAMPEWVRKGVASSYSHRFLHI